MPSQPLSVREHLTDPMCDCSGYELEDLTLEEEEKEPQKVAVQVRLPRPKKK